MQKKAMIIIPSLVEAQKIFPEKKDVQMNTTGILVDLSPHLPCTDYMIQILIPGIIITFWMLNMRCQMFWVSFPTIRILERPLISCKEIPCSCLDHGMIQLISQKKVWT